MPVHHHRRTASHDSSSSAYSATGSESSLVVSKRFATASKGAGDRRRLAIVQLDSSDTLNLTARSIRERRGYKDDLTGLALVAPPDAASHTYTHLTPPSTAPLTGDMLTALKSVRQENTKTHYRSTSDTTQSRSTVDARKVSPTWRLQSKKATSGHTRSPASPAHVPKLADQALTTHSPPPPPETYLTLNTAEFGSPIGTPQIGDSKDIHVPVAAPIVMNLASVAQPASSLSTPSASKSASSTLSGHTQSTQATIDDHQSGDPTTPRPSRLQSPAPPSRTSVDSDTGRRRQTRPFSPSAFKMSEAVPSNDILHDSSVPQTNMYIHRREAATVTKEPVNLSSSFDTDMPKNPSPNPKTDDLTVDDLTSNQLDASLALQYRVLPPTPVAKPPLSTVPTQRAKDSSPPKIDHAKFDQWLKENPQVGTGDIRRRGISLDDPIRSGLDQPKSPLSADHLSVEQPPEPPLKGLRRSLTTKVKRFSSISRAASLSSKSTNRSSQDTRRSSRTPSPLAHYATPTTTSSSHNKIILMNPSALFCHEVVGQTTTLQRCYIYANKINELAMYDCGLSSWIGQMKDQSLIPRRNRGPSSRLFVPQPRHTSRSSIISEATFPRRLDATTATDLSPGQFDDLTSPGLPQLPYPSLALRTVPPARQNTSSSSTSPPTSLRSLTPSFSTSGFFSALGRKASLSKKDRTVLSTRINSPGAAPSGARLPPAKTSQSTNPRPIQITLPPTIPGGPRAPPSRSKRSHTYMVAAAAAATARDDKLLDRTPSLNDPVTVDNVIDIKPDPDFTNQIDQLKALIPRADPNVLVGYLRRAGSDMLAVGQYLEDERMGVIRAQ